MKQTSVEWLVQRLAENGIIHSSDIAKAKQMHKQEIIDFAQEWEDSMLYEYDSKECLYNQTFNK